MGGTALALFGHDRGCGSVPGLQEQAEIHLFLLVLQVEGAAKTNGDGVWVDALIGFLQMEP